MYELVLDENGVVRYSDGVIIPFSDPLNSSEPNPDRLAFEEWLSLGNRPFPHCPSVHHKWDAVNWVWYADTETDVAIQAINDAAVANSQESKAADIQANMPSWNQVESYLDGLANLAEAKLALKKIARVVYWLAKNTKA